MEHLIRRVLRLGTLGIILMSLVGCSSEDPNPELKDPIYKDLLSEYKKHEKLLEDAEKNLKVVEAEMEAVEPRSLDRKIKNREYQKTLKQIVKLRQRKEFFRIKSELRRVYGRKAYRIAYQNKEEWPDPQEFEDYNTNKRLRAAPKNWSHRVPKSKHQQISEDQMKQGAESAK